MRIVLIGFMGCGKSTIGRALAGRLGLPLHEMDELIMKGSKYSSIGELFDHEGEGEFRAIESRIAQSLSAVGDAVISTGGGVVMRDENRPALRSGGDTVIVYLRASFETLRSRISGIEDRPLFRDGTSARALLERRAPIYERWADIIVDTDGRSEEDVCSEILAKV